MPRKTAPGSEPDRAAPFWYVLFDVLHGTHVGTFTCEGADVLIPKNVWIAMFFRSKRKVVHNSAERAWERFNGQVCDAGLKSTSESGAGVLRVDAKRAGDAVFNELGSPHPMEGSPKRSRRDPEDRGGVKRKKK